MPLEKIEYISGPKIQPSQKSPSGAGQEIKKYRGWVITKSEINPGTRWRVINWQATHPTKGTLRLLGAVGEPQPSLKEFEERIDRQEARFEALPPSPVPPWQAPKAGEVVMPYPERKHTITLTDTEAGLLRGILKLERKRRPELEPLFQQVEKIIYGE